MTQDLSAPTAAPPSAAASSAWAVTPAASPLAFRKESDDGFPVAGAVLLVVLMLAAIWAWWYGRTRGGVPVRLPGLIGMLGGRPSAATGELRIVDTLQTPSGVRLMVVEWSGGRRVLVATGGAHAPVVLDTAPSSGSALGAQP